MTKSDKAKTIIRILNEKVDDANSERIRLYAADEAEKAGQNALEYAKSNYDFDYNSRFDAPSYNTQITSDRLQRANDNYKDWIELRNFVNDTFLEMIDE